MAGGLGAVSAGRHVAPATASVLGAVEEHAAAAGVAAAADAAKFTGDERVGAIVDDRHHQCGEGITTGDEVPRVGPVGRELQTSCAGAASEHPVDLGHRFGARVARDAAMFGEGPECAANPSRIEECGRGAGGLLLRSPHDRHAAVMVDHTDGGEPLQHGAEVAEGVAAYAELDVIGVDEIEPETIADEDEGAAIGRCYDEC